MAAQQRAITKWDAVLFCLLFPLHVVRGVLMVVVSVAGVARHVRRATRALSSTLECPSCGEANATVGRWTCGVCHATYHGWVGRCGICGAGCGWFACTCGVAITLPWERP